MSSRAGIETQYSDRDIRAAWAVHALTASGVIVGFVALNAVVDGDARGAILWLVAALLLDGIDGPIARKLDVRSRVPVLNGNSLDLIIDYFTCTIIPVAFLCKFDVLPTNTVGPLSCAILFVSALWMSREDQETEDGWFNGFPAEWNMIVPTVYLLHPNEWVTLAVCIIFCFFTLSRVQFPHPVSVREHRAVSLAIMIAWIGSMVWLAVVQHDVTALRVVLFLAPMWTIFQVIRRQAKTKGLGGAERPVPDLTD